MPNISKARLSTQYIELPPISIQNSFSTFLYSIYRLKKKILGTCDKVDNLFNALMQKAFKGELSFASESVATMEQEAEDVASQLTLFD